MLSLQRKWILCYLQLTYMSQPPISKTAFLDFLFCPKNLWLKLHKPELLDKFVLSDYEQHLAEEGNEVEAHARNLFFRRRRG